jgi:signal transduction histidine kinase
MASHEFRTPLSAILMATETLLAYRKRLQEYQIEDKLQGIIAQVSHLSTIVKNVMQVAKIQEGKEAFEPIRTDIVLFCKKVVDDFNTDHTLNKKIRFSTSIQLLELSVDNRLILQVMNNLLSNAVKYSQPNPEVSVKLFFDQEFFVISIRDNGIGIPAEDQKRLFEPFYRASNTQNIPGNGLGLNIVKEAIQMHGGIIKFKSQPGQGTEFFVHLPKTHFTDSNL